MARYRADGSLDLDFGRDGTVHTEIADGDRARALDVQPDGKVVVAGHSGRVEDTFSLVRYDTDGRLDRGFGDDGKVSTDAGDGETTTDVAIRPDGRIVVGGSTLAAGSPSEKFAVLRYLPRGELDLGFRARRQGSSPMRARGMTISLASRCSRPARAGKSSRSSPSAPVTPASKTATFPWLATTPPAGLTPTSVMAASSTPTSTGRVGRGDRRRPSAGR